MPPGLFDLKLDYMGAVLSRDHPQHSLPLLVGACALLVTEATSLTKSLLICEVLVLSIIGDGGDIRMWWVHKGHVLYACWDGAWARAASVLLI